VPEAFCRTCRAVTDHPTERHVAGVDDTLSEFAAGMRRPIPLDVRPEDREFLVPPFVPLVPGGFHGEMVGLVRVTAPPVADLARLRAAVDGLAQVLVLAGDAARTRVRDVALWPLTRLLDHLNGSRP